MARRRNGVQDFFDGFNQSYGSVRKLLQDKELAEIANAKPETIEGQVNDPDGAFVAPTQQKFLGQTSNTPLTDGQVTNARTMAMAGVMKKYGNPMEGLRLEQQAKAGVREDARFTREERLAKRQDDHQDVIDKVDKDVANWNSKRLINPDGSARDMTIDDQLAVGQYRASKLVQAGKLTDANALAKDNMQFASNKIQLQTAERNEALVQTSAAIAAGDLSKLGQFYDKFVPDGARVKSIAQDPESGAVTVARETLDGRALAPHTFKSKDEVLAALNTFKDPMALYNFSQSEFHRNLQTAADKRAEKQLGFEGDRVKLEGDRLKNDEKRLGIEAGRATVSNELGRAQIGEITQKTADRKELGDIHVGLNAAIESGDAKAADLYRKQLMSYTLQGRGNSNLSVEEKRANFYLASGAAKNIEDAAKMSHEKVQASPKDDYIKLTTSAMPLMGDQLSNAMQTLHGANWKAKVQGGGSAPEPIAYGSGADTEAAAKSGKLKKGDKIIVNGVDGTWQ